ncbi:MAG: hypothetical protein ACXWUG_16505 [Polyangiales bacterium]
MRFVLIAARLWVGAALSTAAGGCGTVDLGTYEGVRDLKLPEDYFYCTVQPLVITAKKCASGDPAAGDAPGGCHSSASPMRLEQIDTPVACSGGKPTGTPSSGERANYTAASLRASRNVDASPILAKPTSATNHPRQIFTSDSQEATYIRNWISGAR